MLDFIAELSPPAPVPRDKALGPISLLRLLADNPLEAWTSAHFEKPIVINGLSIGRVAVVNDPAAIRRVLFDNCENYQKDWLQRRVLSAGLIGGLLTAEGHNWRTQRRALAPLFARHETTANCISWTLFLLSQSAEWRQRVQSEADRELDGALDALSDRLVETRAVIEETNRLYPPITAVSRVAIGRDELAGEPIKPGTMIVIAPYVIHRHRALWTKPDNFDPNRFLGHARETIDRFSYLPFGVGPRICICATFAIQEASVAVATIMRNFRLEMVSGCTPWPVQKVTLRPKGGLPMVV